MSSDFEPIITHFTTLVGGAFSQGILELGKNKISKWIVRRGMEFHSPWIWWGNINKTREETYGGGPHEGLDFALAEKKETRGIEAGMEGLRIPVFTDGKVIWSFKDLVGDTVIVAVGKSFESWRLIIQYSHIDFENAQVGESISQGDDIGTIRLSSNPKSITASHLHISVALIDETLLKLPNSEVDFNNWLAWDQSGQLVYFDPLKLVSSAVLESRFVLGEKANSPISRLVSTGATKEERLNLRRCLCRNFPGIQSIGKKTATDAAAHMKSDGLLINIEDGSWTMEYGSELKVTGEDLRTGKGCSELIAAISNIETVNRLN